MAKLTDLTEVTTLADGDLAIAVDVSNTSMDATGTNSKVTLANVYAYIKAKTDLIYGAILGYTPENVANKSTTTSLGTSDTLYPTQNAVKTYVDGLVAGLLDYRGAYNASVNTFPASGGSGTAGAIMKGDMWVVSNAGTLGGTAVQVGDSLIANVDTPGQTAGNWNILNGNISYVPEDQANKSDNTALGTSTTLYPTQNATKVYADTKALLAGSTSQAFSVSQLEVGNTDTTITRNAAGVIAVEGVVIPSISSTNTLTNKRITPRAGTTTSSATPTINTDNYDYYSLTAQTVDITSFTTNLTGTPTDGQKLWISVTGTAARAITWGASFESSTATLPTTTVTTARLDVGFVWNTATSKWRCVAIA